MRKVYREPKSPTSVSVLAAQRSEAKHVLLECLCVRPSGRLSVCLSHSDPRQTGSRYPNMIHTIRESDVSSFLKPNFTIISLEVHPERVR